MKNLIFKLLLMAAAFAYVLPMINGIDVHGNLGNALGLAIFFAMMTWIVSFLAKFLSALLAISTFGLALLVIIPIWFLGFWLLPAVTLKIVSDIMPQYLVVTGWMPAIWGGLVMFFVGVLTDAHTLRDHRKRIKAQ